MLAQKINSDFRNFTLRYMQRDGKMKSSPIIVLVFALIICTWRTLPTQTYPFVVSIIILTYLKWKENLLI